MNLTALRRSGAVALLVVGGGVAVLVASHHADAVELTSAASKGPNDEKRAAPLADAAIAQATLRHLQEDPALRGEHIQVTVTGGVATISGTLTTLLAEARAVAVVDTIKGIRAVVDTTAVAPSTRTDDQIKGDLARALDRDPATPSLTLATAVTDRKVTLSGSAASWRQKKLVADVARGVQGVQSLDDAITVHSAWQPEPVIASEIKQRLANDVWLAGETLTATVKDRNVQLGGVVGSVAQRKRAVADAWVDGVVGVDDTHLVVDWSAANAQRHVTDFPVPTDQEIADAVRAVFRDDPRLQTLAPRVVVDNGEVILDGAVETASARQAAEDDAKDTVGVWRVRDELLTLSAASPTDAQITRSTNRAISRDPLLAANTSFRTSSANGKVLLKGAASSGFDRLAAVADVSGVPGVVAIDDELTVTRTPAEVTRAIADQLQWDARVEGDRVSLSVAPDGVTTLAGTLDAWSERKSAEDDAIRGGATRVINLLTLKNHADPATR